jgi:uncharacterized protein
MLRVDIRLARNGVVPVEVAVAPDDPVFQGLEIGLDGPVRVAGSLTTASRGTWRFDGRVSGTAKGDCRRCLKPVEGPFTAPITAVYSTATDIADDPGVYPLVEPVTAIDLSAAVREEVGLTAPQWMLCREDCAGLCAVCGADLNEGPCEHVRSREHA